MSRQAATSIALVAAGGAIGTAARLALGLLIPDAGGVPLSILIANVLGSLLIGILAARLPASSRTRVFLGTGLLGGFTTYSAYALGIIELWAVQPLIAIAYAVGSVVLGLAAAALGLRLGRPRGPARPAPAPGPGTRPPRPRTEPAA